MKSIIYNINQLFEEEKLDTKLPITFYDKIMYFGKFTTRFSYSTN